MFLDPHSLKKAFSKEPLLFPKGFDATQSEQSLTVKQQYPLGKYQSFYLNPIHSSFPELLGKNLQ